MSVHFLSDWLLLAGALLVLTTAATAFTTNRAKFKAAVYEHDVIPPFSFFKVSRAKALADMKKNLDIYAEQTKLAKEQGAEIIVFPEDGLYWIYFTRDTIYPFLETIPDPRVVDWSPCQDPTRFKDTEVQYTLSCMARNQSMYVVADMGDKQPCNVTSDPGCPPDGRYQYNTAVAFGPDGRLLARYHKSNLFPLEAAMFDVGKHEVIYFDTPFGRFGLFICFDIFMYEPAVTMVTQHKIANIAYPTNWVDALPLLSALGFHSSFARALGVNFLSANVHKPHSKSTGSGMYGPDGMKAFYYNNALFSPTKLLVTELDVLDKPRPQPHNVSISVPSHKLKFKSETGRRTQLGQSKVDASGIENDYNVAPQPMIPDSYGRLVSSNDVFHGILFGDNFTFLEVDGLSGNKSICSRSNKVCCHLNYTKTDAATAKEGGETDLFAFGVFDGVHTIKFHVYLQVCALVRCADSNDRSSCGTATTESSTAFKKIEIRGTFQTPYVYPEVVLHEPPTDLKLADPSAWSYDGQTLLTNSEMQSPVVSAALFGRDFSKDNSSIPIHH